MPQFKISKTRYVNNLPETKSEDTIYIVKNRNNFGELYYDYDENNRIKLSNSNQLYRYNNNLESSKKISLSDLNLITFTINGDVVEENEQSLSGIIDDNIFVGQLLRTNNGVGIIMNIINNSNELIITPLYTNKALRWVDLQ